MCDKWQCYAWEGKSYTPTDTIMEACHRRHAEINLLNRLHLKGCV